MERAHHKINPTVRTVIACRGILGVPRELVGYLSALLRTERRARGIRTGPRALTCWNQALFVLAWFRTNEDLRVLGAGSGSAGPPPPGTGTRAWSSWPSRL